MGELMIPAESVPQSPETPPPPARAGEYPAGVGAVGAALYPDTAPPPVARQSASHINAA